jgi:glutathione synthase/RimK-type ligase-like ATP-grasp enzyme
MWHWSHLDYRAHNFARQLIISLESNGKKVFPSVSDCWHYDDKVGQKYLLESMGAAMVPTYIFYQKEDALSWIMNATFPKVFKLRGGAGSSNVRLVKDRSMANKLVHRSFNHGFPMMDRVSGLRQRTWVIRRDKNMASVIHMLKGLAKYVLNIDAHDLLPRQKGYILFQDFIPNNLFDDRIVVVGDRAFALRRLVREGDFRASGSGRFLYDRGLFQSQVLEIAFQVTKALKAQSLAFDFVYDREGKPLIIEISYAYSMGSAYDNCPGYWDSQLNWYNKPVNPQYFMIEDFIRTCK